MTNLEEPEHGESEHEIMLPEESTEYVELGYHIFRPFRRQGYAEEACRAVLNYAKEELACPVCAHVAKENTASIQMLEKLGVPYFIINPKRNV